MPVNHDVKMERRDLLTHVWTLDYAKNPNCFFYLFIYLFLSLPSNDFDQELPHQNAYEYVSHLCHSTGPTRCDVKECLFLLKGKTM